jgi:hypothetical protein
VTSPAGHPRVRRDLVAAAIVTLCIVVLGGGLVLSNAWAIGDSIDQQIEPSASVPPVAHRRWYARAVFFALEGAASPVPDQADNAARD